VLRLDHNQLSGPIPPEIGSLKMGYVLLDYTYPGTLRLDHNQLSGSIPGQIGCLSMGGPYGPGNLYLDHNRLTGPIPSAIGNVIYLGTLALDDNQLSGSIPPEIGDLSMGAANWPGNLYLDHNRLTGPIPSTIGDLTYLVTLALNDNQLSGPIPPEIGHLARLYELDLSGNQLSGPIPASLANLTALFDGHSDLRWNALYTSDATLRAFLNSKQIGFDWEGTQTVAPTDLAAGSATLESIPLSWTPILYTGDTGGYRIWYGTLAGGPYNLRGTTMDKTVSALTLGGFSPGTTYYFAFDTVTEPHANNQNRLVSERTPGVSAATLPGGPDWYSLTVVREGPGNVSSSPAWIACGGVCSATFAPGTPVTLTASPDPGFRFYGWGGACTGTALTCTLTMDAAQTVTASFNPPATSFYTVTPCRVFDSRDAGLGGPSPLAAGTDTPVVIGGACAIPATAKAVSLNVTAVSATASGHLRLYASDMPRPTTSSINYTSGQTRANNAVVSLGADGALIVYANQPSGTVHVVIDVNGYFQ
jgi:hypothetical protein